MASQPSNSPTDIKARRDAERRAALVVYALVFVTFFTLCTVAVIAMMQRESERQGFRPIEVSKPISFFDRTYMKKTPEQAAEVQQPAH
jgi:uncharacterized membrane protein